MYNLQEEGDAEHLGIIKVASNYHYSRWQFGINWSFPERELASDPLKVVSLERRVGSGASLGK